MYHYDVEKQEAHNRQKANVAIISVTSNASLVALKLIIGLGIGSVSVISEAIHSAVDLLAAVIAFFAVRKAAKPADFNHPFGHGKVENISGAIEALLIFLAAGWIIIEALRKLRDPEPLDDAGWGVAVMMISAIANIAVSRRLFAVGKETDSMALQADAWHLRTDVYTSAGVMTGLALIWLGGYIFPGANLHWIDPLAAMIVAVLIIKTAYELTIASAKDLLDVSLPECEESQIRKSIGAFAPAVKGFYNLRTRKSGPERFVEFDMFVDGHMTVDEAHRIADMVTDSIEGRYPGTKVTIHIEPCNESDYETCPGQCFCFLNEDVRKAIRMGK